MHAEVPLPTWGIAAHSGLWPVTIRILFLIDGRILLSSGAIDFGLGNVLETLRSVWSWWVRFEVDIATRETTISDYARAGNTVITNFSFTHGSFDIDRYHQIWFFGDQPSEDDGDETTTDEDIVPPFTLEPDELRLIAEWMDRGGGVFATGDHGVLGASMCSRIPRVRTMRRWTRAQLVPSLNGPGRHQTLQGGSDILGEDDTLLQPVQLVFWTTAHQLPFHPVYRPHPVMCSNWGVIDKFPDHMHEGDLVADDLVELDLPLNIPGYDRPEYPQAIPEVLGAGLTDVGPFQFRPRPQIVAFGRTTNPHFPDLILAGAVAGIRESLLSKRFGLVSVYDGNPAQVGRVVCDSTWHHWFSMNLVGIVNGDLAAYRKMQAYYRNIAMWLSSIAGRQAMLVSALWGAMIGSWPGFFAREQSEWEMGERALQILANTMSPCLIDEVVASFVDVRVTALRHLSAETRSAPQWGGLSTELLNRALVGSMCRAMFETASAYRRTLVRYDRADVDPEQLHALARRGAYAGVELLRQTLTDAATSFAKLRDDVRSVNPDAS